MFRVNHWRVFDENPATGPLETPFSLRCVRARARVRVRVHVRAEAACLYSPTLGQPDAAQA